MHSPYCAELCPVLKRKIIQAKMQAVVSKDLGSPWMHCPSPNLLHYPAGPARGGSTDVSCSITGMLWMSHHCHYHRQSPFLHLAKATDFPLRVPPSPTQRLDPSTWPPSSVHGWSTPDPIKALHPSGHRDWFSYRHVYP